MPLIEVRGATSPPIKYSRLHAHMLSLGITQRWLSEKTGIHYRTVGAYIHGERSSRRPAPRHLDVISATLGIPADWITDSRQRWTLKLVEAED